MSCEKYLIEDTLVQIGFLKTLYFGQHNESIKKRKRKPDFTKSQNLSKRLIISMGKNKKSG